MANDKVLNVIHVSRRDGLQNWSGSYIPLRYGELALGYGEDSGSGDGMLAEIRAGHVSGALTWSELTTFVPAFPVVGSTIQEQINARKNKVLGYDENGMPTFLPRGAGAFAVVSKSEGIDITQEDANTYSIGINGNGWEITGGGASPTMESNE